MDVRTRVLTARLAVRVEDNKNYSRRIGIINYSDYRRNKGSRTGKVLSTVWADKPIV